MNHSPSLQAGYLRLRQGQLNKLPNSSDDWFVLEDMKQALTRHLQAALIECAALSRDLTGVAVDPDQLLVDVRHQFDPDSAVSPIQDAFADAFFKHVSALKDASAEPITSRKSLPSGSAGE